MYAKTITLICLVFSVSLTLFGINESGEATDLKVNQETLASTLSGVQKQVTALRSIPVSETHSKPESIDDAILKSAKEWPVIAKNHFATLTITNPESKSSAEAAEFTKGVTTSPLGFKLLKVNGVGTYLSLSSLVAMLSKIAESGIAITSLTLNGNAYTVSFEIYGI